MTMDLRSLGHAFAVLGVLAPLTLSGCNNDPQSGGLTIRYGFAPGVSCDMNQEAVDEIRVDVGPDGVEGTQSVTCDKAGGELVLAGVDAGTYDLFVLGIDPEGDAVLDNLGGNVSDDRVEIIGGDSKEVDVTLGLAPARLEVGLVVNNNGFPAQCSSTEIMVKGIRAEAWDFGSSDLLKSHDFDLCDFDGFEAVPDEDREINGRRFDGVVLQPLDATGNPVGTSQQIQFADAIGAGKVAQVSVTCEGDSCDAQLLGGAVGNTSDTSDPTGGDPTGDDGMTDGGTTGGGATDGGDTTAGG